MKDFLLPFFREVYHDKSMCIRPEILEPYYSSSAIFSIAENLLD